MPRISPFIYSLILVSVVTVVITLFMSDLSSHYGTSFDNETFTEYDQLNELSDMSEDLEQSTKIKEKTGVLDIIGSYFSEALSALRITARSFNVFDGMANAALESLDLGVPGRVFRIAISSIGLIFLSVAIILSAIVNREM